MATTAAARRADATDLHSELVRVGRILAKHDSGDTRRTFAELLVDLRESFTDPSGRPDYAGRSKGYREALNAVYSASGLPTEEQDRVLRTGIRYHVQKIVRDRFRAKSKSDADYLEFCRYYGFKPENSDESRKRSARLERVTVRGLVTVSDAIAFLADARSKTEAFVHLNNVSELPRDDATALRDELNSLMETLAPVVAAIDTASAVEKPKRKRRA
jgi:hypothetical protein